MIGFNNAHFNYFMNILGWKIKNLFSSNDIEVRNNDYYSYELPYKKQNLGINFTRDGVNKEFWISGTNLGSFELDDDSENSFHLISDFEVLLEDIKNLNFHIDINSPPVQRIDIYARDYSNEENIINQFTHHERFKKMNEMFEENRTLADYIVFYCGDSIKYGYGMSYWRPMMEFVLEDINTPLAEISIPSNRILLHSFS